MTLVLFSNVLSWIYFWIDRFNDPVKWHVQYCTVVMKAVPGLTNANLTLYSSRWTRWVSNLVIT